jgi:DNA polymerase III delta subunit
MKPYPAKKLAAQSADFTSEGLRRALAVFSRLDLDLKGGSELRPDLSLELALARVMEGL